MRMINAAKVWLKAIGVAIGLIPTLAGAALTVIYDSGDTWPIAPFLNAFESTETTATPASGDPESAVGCGGSRPPCCRFVRRV